MFLGTTPRDHSAVLLPQIRSWGCADLAFPCSGNFTIPRSLVELGARMHGNDVTLYSCTLGNHFAGRPTEIQVAEGFELEWLAPYLVDSAAQTATLMVWSGFANAWRKRTSNDYYARVSRAAKAQFPALHAKALGVLARSQLKLASFFAGDCVAFLDEVPRDAGVVSYPPIYAKGYERLWKDLEAQLLWTPPQYEMSDDAHLDSLVSKVRDREHWAIISHVPLPQLSDCQYGQVKVTNRAPTAHFYGSNLERRSLVAPNQKSAALNIPRLTECDPTDGPLELLPLSSLQFSGLRSAYLNADIPPGSAQLAVAVLVAGKLAGAFAFGGASNVTYKDVPQPTAYLLSDFAVSPGPPRLSKLVAAAALSREARLLLERRSSLRFQSLVTTAFSNNPASMKYRGILKLLCRTEVKDDPLGPFKFKLSYGGPFGAKSLKEVLATWKGKHASPCRVG